MKHHHHHRASIALLATTLLTVKTWSAQPLTIVNSGFENPVVADGSTGAVPNNWNIVNAANVNSLNPNNISDLSAEAPEGSNVVLITSSSAEDGVSQTLPSLLQAGSVYTLTAKVANTKFSGGFPGYRVQLLAGSTVIAEDDNSQTIAEDAVVTSTVNYTYNAGAHSGLVGQALQIRLLSKGLSTAQEVAFDDIQLAVTLVNPTANPGGPYTVPISGALSLNGSSSLPSDGQAITSWEWDLDNDGDFDEAITGATPAAISYATLQATYLMKVGANTIKLRVTDDSLPTPKTSTINGTVNLAAPIGCQLGVLNLTANGGINPNTGLAWAVGDRYRIAFHTLGTTTTTSNSANFYNDFATAQAWTRPALQGTYWRAMVTVNLDPTTTQALSPKSEVRTNTGTNDLTGGANQGGAGGPVYVVNGTTCIARNNADIWNAWSNPFENSVGVVNAAGTGNNNTRVTGVFYSPFLDQNGNQTVNPNVNHGMDVATGCNFDGSHVNALGDTTDAVDNIARGNANANTTGRVWNRFTDLTTVARSVYAISVPLTIQNTAETVKPTLISFADNRAGANLPLDTGSIIYTVTFSEALDASTITTADFENGGTAAVNITSIRGTLNPAAFEITVTPTTTGTVQLQAKASTVIEDPVGNTLDTTSAIADDTIINVISDVTPPTLVSITDNRSGAEIVAFNPVTYTVTFSEAMIAATVNVADFGNTGTAPATINSVTATANPAVYTVVATPTGAGSLVLGVVAGATMTDLIALPLVTTTALPDDTTITVTPDPLPTLVSIVDNQSGGPVVATQAFTYLVTFSQAINASTVDATDFENSGSPALNVNAVARTSNPRVYAVHVTSGGAGANTLRIKAGAVITNLNGTALDTTAAIADDTTITVNAGSGPARETITLDGTVTFFGTTATLSGTLNASASDKLVVIVTGENSNPGDLTGNSTAVTYDGVALTKVIDRNPIGGTPFDQTYNDVWYLDNPATSTGAIVASVNARGSVTAFALSGTAPGVGQTAISPQASKSVVLSTSFANSFVIASHGMGGDGNTANFALVNADLPLIERSAIGQTSLWDGHVTATALVPTPGTASYSFNGGNLTGSHTIAAEFLAAVVVGTPFGNWAAGPFSGTLTDSSSALDFDGGGLPTGIEWVVGGDPTNGSDDPSKAPTANSNDPNNFVFTYSRRDAAHEDPKTSISVQYGSDLSGWTTATNGPNGISINDATVPAVGFRTVVVTIPKSLASGGKIFARLRAVVSP